MKIVYTVDKEEFVCERSTAKEIVEAIADARGLGELTVAKVIRVGLQRLDYNKNRLPNCASVVAREKEKGERVSKEATKI